MTAERWREADARRALDAWGRSGLTIAQFARAQGVAPDRLYEWRRKLAATTGDLKTAIVPDQLPALMPVRVAAAASGDQPISVLLRSGHVLRVPRGFDEGVFSRVVALLKEA